MKKEPGIILNSVFLALGVILPVARAQNPVPFIGRLSPLSVAPAQTQPLSLTIKGAGFAPGATVNFGGATFTPDSITNAQITVTIPAASLAVARTTNVTVVNPNAPPLAAISNVASLSITNPTAAVFGTTTFTSAQNSPFQGPFPGPSPVVGDFNGDGNLDVATIDQGGTSVTLLLGDGSGHLVTAASPVILPNGVNSPLVAGDFNGDHNLDLAFVGGCPGAASQCLFLLLGDGTGSFSIASSALLTSTTAPVVQALLTAGDFNSDGKLDLAVSFGGNPATITVMFGDGAGNFNRGPSISLSGNPNSMVTGDFNGDGKLDLAISAENTQGPYVTYLLGDGAGDFTFGTGAGAFTPGLADFNGDGKLDWAGFIGVNEPEGFGPYLLAVQLGDGAGNFGPVLPFQQLGGGIPEWLAAGDFNGDGRMDVIVLSYNPDSPSSGGFTIFLQSAVVDVTNSFTVTSTGLIRSPVSTAGFYGFYFHGTVTLTNIGTQTLSGPLQLLFADLPPGVDASPYGIGYFAGPDVVTIDTGPGGIAPGQSTSVEVTFFEKSNNRITYTPYVYLGTL